MFQGPPLSRDSVPWESPHQESSAPRDMPSHNMNVRSLCDAVYLLHFTSEGQSLIMAFTVFAKAGGWRSNCLAKCDPNALNGKEAIFHVQVPLPTITSLLRVRINPPTTLMVFCWILATVAPAATLATAALLAPAALLRLAEVGRGRDRKVDICWTSRGNWKLGIKGNCAF